MKSPLSTSSSRRTLLRFALECALFSALLFALHAAHYAGRGSSDVPSEVAQVRALVRETADVLYLGDSTLFMGRPGESDTRSTAAMLRELSPNMPIAEISTPAGHMDFYEAVADYLSRHPDAVRLVIVPLNLRMLAPQLEEHSYRRFDREKAFLRHDSAFFEIVYRPLSVFKAFGQGPTSIPEFENAPVLDGDTNLGILGPFNPAVAVPVTPDQRRRIIMFSYMFQLSREDPVLLQLESLIHKLQSANIEVLLYVTPLDFESCQDELGERFLDRLDQNVLVLTEVAEEYGVPLVDLSKAAPHEHFAWEHYPNEHMDARGREMVATALLESIRSEFGLTLSPSPTL